MAAPEYGPLWTVGVGTSFRKRAVPPGEGKAMDQQLAYFDRSPRITSGYKTGVSLHSHTLDSSASAASLVRCVESSAIARLFVRRAHKRYGERSLEEGLSRMWWTPPLTPRQAFDLEVRQIEDRLDLEPIVSMSDHDSIAAPMLCCYRF